MEQYKTPIIFFLLGIILLGIGILSSKLIDFSSEPKVEVLGEESQKDVQITAGEIMVEIAGEVMKPGVYSFTSNNRVNDLLLAAGGLSAEADRAWVAQNINLAQRLADGVKIYIPSKNSSLENTAKANINSGKINVNTASLAELDTLYGIGPVTAQKIIDSRPYDRVEILLEKGIVKKNVWEEIKDKISVY